MRDLIDFNTGWLFEGAPVDLPHTAVELPFSYFDERDYQRAFTYAKAFTPDPAWEGREVALVFDGAMADAQVLLNGTRVGSHADGYTPFEVRLTDALQPGENRLEVRIDGNENPAIPPFGGVIDYLAYAGIYREVWLKVTAPVFIENVKIETPDALAAEKRISARIEIANPQGLALSGTIKAELKRDGQTLATASAQVHRDIVALSWEGLKDIELWDLSSPVLYDLSLTLTTPSGTDHATPRFGFREARFTPDGFHLNGRPLKLLGLNRHQAFPYAGYALGRAAQRRDAEILKHELKLNMVRTSHYPQSTHFLDRCDELGLLVFEEIPGWQHIGDKAWQAASVDNVRAMIRRDWNHPSIVIWGVRINESQDSHDFYAETNRVARELDPTRQTGGVRFITDSELLEDVYTMNDFILGNEELGGNRPRTALRPRAETTGLDHPVPYMITEFGGHMYPTKNTDQEQRQAEHVLRHLEVLDAAFGDPQIAGAIGWCAFDYNTHKDFGSGDRICYHGVMDMFREPKFAAYVYRSQCDPGDEPVLMPVTFWSRGERNIGGVLPLIVLTNCDEIELRYGSATVKRIAPDRERFPHLPHAPVIVDRKHFSKDELGRWGMRWEPGAIAGYVGGRKVIETRFSDAPVPARLEVVADATRIAPRDCTRIAIRALDQEGHRLPFFADPVSIRVEGPARLIGPDLVPLRGGVTAAWVVATGMGDITVTVANARLGEHRVTLQAGADG